jgi:hypothetical protein
VEPGVFVNLSEVEDLPKRCRMNCTQVSCFQQVLPLAAALGQSLTISSTLAAFPLFEVGKYLLEHLRVTLKLGETFLENLVDLLEILVDVLESLVDVLESLVDVLEILVDVLEILVDVVEIRVDSFETILETGEAHFKPIDVAGFLIWSVSSK